MPNIFPLCNFSSPKSNYKTEYIIVVSMDGIRYSEAWGDVNRTYIPNLDALSSEGVLFTNFNNNGQTVTNPGHAAMTTGKYQNIANDGSQDPDSPSFFQQYRKFKGTPQTDCYLITSKDKLIVLDNTTNSNWINTYAPSADCGVNGNGTGGYRSDTITLNHVLNAITVNHPHIIFVNFKEPDEQAHSGVFSAYTSAISSTDLKVKTIWDAVQADPTMQNKTTMFVLTDHGRHLQGVSDGFIGHGDTCEGCVHTFCFAIGPDFAKNVEIDDEYEPIDIAPTICALLGFKMNYNTGSVIDSVFLP